MKYEPILELKSILIKILVNFKMTNCRFHDTYIERYNMKLRTLAQNNQNKKLKMIITENQFRVLAQNVLYLQEQKQIMNTHLIKRNATDKEESKK